MIDTLEAGQTITCTVTRSIRSKSGRDTVLRLMRLDPAIRKGLKQAQMRRMKRLLVRPRGGRQWAVREKAAKLAHPEPGASWTMKWIPHVAPDLRSVEQYLEIKPV